MKYFALGLLACVGMSSCSSSDDFTGDGGQNGGATASTSYLAVNILNTGSTGSRAFSDGEADENDISELRFYLFDEGGAAHTLANGKSYVTPTYTVGSNPTGGNVEEIGTAILSLEGIPQSIVAVANGTDLADTYTLTGLQAATTSAYKNASGDFTMSNSVYADKADGSGSKICAVSVSGHVASSQEAAKATPVDIYIERLAAKVKVTFPSSDGWTTIGDKPAYLLSGTAGDAGAVYAQIQGWDLVYVPNKENVLKDIEATWKNDDLGYNGTTPWTSADYHRSYWAKMPASMTTNDFAKAFTPTGITNTAPVYTLENTSENNKTQLLVAVKLVDKDGKPSPRYVYLTEEYDSETAVLTQMLSVFTNAQHQTYYVKTSSEDTENNYTSLAPSDLKFVSGASLDDAAHSYRAYAQLKTPFAAAMEGEKENLYTKSEDGKYEKVADLATINNALKKDYYAQIWKDGWCYYTSTIQHDGSDGKTAAYGVVRNHVYDITVKKISGWGTPVYTPEQGTEQIPYPVIPEDDNSYVSTNINILSWKVVSKDVTLGQ